MLKFLFGRYSRWVRIVEGLGLGLTLFNLARSAFLQAWVGADTLMVILLLQYLFIRTCRGINWYPEARYRRESDPELGIEVHFLKALVPTGYILLGSSALFLAGFEWTAMILANLMLFVVSGVNGILVTFHFRDDRLLPVNYFTRNLYLEDRKSLEGAPARQPEVSAA